jgi:L-glyceraldehyde 3-phosphate reductase
MLRYNRTNRHLTSASIQRQGSAKLNSLNDLAAARGQKLSQMALSWILHNDAITTVLIGASRSEQIEDNVRCIEKLDFSEEEIAKIENILRQ